MKAGRSSRLQDCPARYPSMDIAVLAPDSALAYQVEESVGIGDKASKEVDEAGIPKSAAEAIEDGSLEVSMQQSLKKES